MQFGGTPMAPSPSSAGSNFGHQFNGNGIFQNGNHFQANHSQLQMFAPQGTTAAANGASNGLYSGAANGQPQQQHHQPQQPPQQLQGNQQQGQQPQGQQHQQQQQQQQNGNGTGAPLVYPALHLHPLNDTFAPKQISLAPPGPHNKIKIGRQTNAKSIPQPSNGYFDSKVLSRMHAEVWSQDGKVFIKDVKSSNGTFINGERLSPEAQESDVFELHNEDMVEFGIDIVGEDNKSIIHHKVSCRVFLVLTAEEALGLRNDFAALYRGGIAGGGLGHQSVGPGAEGGLRRSKLGVGGGSVGGTSFDHILHKLQAELQKSREQANDLGTLTQAMGEIGETLGGGLPPMQNPPYQHMVPPVHAQDKDGRNSVGGQGTGDGGAEAAATAAAAASETIKALEEQIHETQRTLNLHMDRLAGLEAKLEEHDGVRDDVGHMRSQVNEARRELAEAVRQRQKVAGVLDHQAWSNGLRKEEAGEDFDDGASVASMDTVVAGGEDSSASNEKKPFSQRSALGKGPIGVDEVEADDITNIFGDDEMQDEETLARLKNHVGPLAPPDGVPVKKKSEEDESFKKTEELNRRLEAMEQQLERALELGRTLAGQHAEATEAVKRLEEKVKLLESTQPDASANKEADSTTLEAAAAAGLAGTAGAGGILAALESRWGKWRDAFEKDWAKEKSQIDEDRRALQRVVQLWDSLNGEVEDVLEGQASSSSTDTSLDEDGVGGPLDREGSSAAVSVPDAESKLSSAARKRRKRRAAAAKTRSDDRATSSAEADIRSSLLDGDVARMNRELRALLYTDDFNLLAREANLDSSTSAASGPLSQQESRSASASSSSVGTRGAGTPTQTSLDSLLDHSSRRGPAFLSAKRGGGGGARDGSASLPMLGAAGVFVFGMTAWILAGKGGTLGATGG